MELVTSEPPSLGIVFWKGWINTGREHPERVQGKGNDKICSTASQSLHSPSTYPTWPTLPLLSTQWRGTSTSGSALFPALELNIGKIKADYRWFLWFFPPCWKDHNSLLKWLLPRVAADWKGCYAVISFSCRKWDNYPIPLSEKNTYLWAKCFFKITLYNSLDFITSMYLQLLINTNRARTLMRSFNEKLSPN